MAGCVQVGVIKCYIGAPFDPTIHPVGSQNYFMCSTIDGVTPNSGHIGQTVRMDNVFSDADSHAWTVNSIDPLPNYTSTSAPLTTNATCTPAGTPGSPNYSCDYTWEQVRVRIPDGYNQDGTTKFKYRAFIFSPLYYEAKTNNAVHSPQYPEQLYQGNWSVTRGSMETMSDNSWFHRVVYLFADEDGKYPIKQKTYPPHYGGTVPDPTMNIGPTEDGPDNPATANTNMDPAQAGVMSGNDPGMPFSMWSPGMPMEGVYPEVGDIVKITHLDTDYRDSVWYNTSTPWNHVLPVQDPCPGEYSWITTHTDCGTHLSRNPYQTWAGGTSTYLNPPSGTITPNQDEICLQVIAVITEGEFNSNNTFLPSQAQPVLNGFGYSPGQASDLNIHPCYTQGVEGCHYRNRANNTRKGDGIRVNNNTTCAQGGIGHMTLYMNPNPNWTGIYNMGMVDQAIGNVGDADCYDVCAYKTAQDNTFPNIAATGWNSHIDRQWNPRLNDEGPPHLPWTWDCCNIHCPVERFREDNQQPCWTRGYKVPYDGRYIIKYEAEVYQSFGGGGGFWGDPSRWSAWVTIDRQIVTLGGNGAIYYSNPNTWCQDCGYGGGDSYLPTAAPFKAAYTSAGTGNFNCYWDADDSNGVFIKDSLEFEITLEKGMEIQIVFLGINYDFNNTNWCRIRNQYFRVYPRPGVFYSFGQPAVMNDIPPPGALCFCTPKTQTWYGHPQYGGTAHQNNDGILAEPGHDWDCEYCGHNFAFPHNACCRPYWTGTTTICESAEECLGIPSWNCDLSLSYLPVTIDPDGTGEWWRIEGKGCIDPGDGSGTFKSFSGNSYGSISCIEHCNPPWWECDGNGGCTSASTVAPTNAYLTEASCIANCVVESWDCDMTQGFCYDPGTGLGQYTSLTTCNQHCHATTWNCGGAVGGTPGVCYQSNGPGGQYMTQAACQSNCFPDTYNCVQGSCVNPLDGTGLYASLVICEDTCSNKEPCSVYISTISSGQYTEPGGTVFNNGIHNICIHDLWYYDVTASTTTWVMKLPQTIGSGFAGSCYHRNGIASTKTKLWTYRAIDSECIIKEYDINQTDPTILTHNRDIDILPIVGTYQEVSTLFLTAINNKTLILAKKDPSGSTGLMVVNLNIHPVVGPVATDKFIIPGIIHDSDVAFLPSETAIFVSDETGQIRKYDYIGGTLLTSYTPSDDLDGLFMHEGNIYATSSVTNKKFLVDKQTCSTTFVGYISIDTPYTTGGIWQTTLNVPTNITLGGTIGGNEVSITNSSSSPCCDNNQANCGACLETLSQYMPSSGVNFIQYQHNMPGAMYGDCVSDPGGCCYCCTFADSPTPAAPPSNSSSRLYVTTLSYVEGISKNNEKVTHLEEIKRWIANPRNTLQNTSWNSIYFAKRNNEYEKGECGEDFEAISLFSISMSVNGVSHTFDDTSTWSDVIKHSVGLGAPVNNTMVWDEFIKVMYASFDTNKFSYSVSEISCGCYDDETNGPKAKAKSFPCAINNGNYMNLQGQWRECEVDIHGNDCTGSTMNWGCCGGNTLPSLYMGYVCDNRQSICPSGCAKIDTGYVGYNTESFFAWYTQVSNGFYAIDIRTIKYILNNLPNQVSYPCYENSVGWWYHHNDQFGVAWTSTTGTVTAHFNSYGTSWFSTWLDFITALFSNNFVTANLGLTFNQLLSLPYHILMNKLQLLQPGFALHFHGSPCKCDDVECVQNVPKPDGYLTKDDCQNSYLINDCPHSDQRCTPDPWRCVKKQVPMPDAPPGSVLVGPHYKCFCVQDGGGNYTTPSYATEELCKEAKNCCLPETYNCESSESDCVGKTLLPHIVGRWWDGVQATNIVTATPIATSTELFANPIFGHQSTDIRSVRWEYSLMPANTISSDDCRPTSPLALAWAAGSNPPLSPQAPWIVVTGLEFKDPYETINISNSLGLPGLPVYTWLDYIDLLNNYGVGTTITPSMSSAQVGSIIQAYMGWSSITHGITWRRCQCDPFTTSCHCVDPGDGSGTYSSLYGCQTNPFSCCGSLPSIAPPVSSKVGSFNTVEFSIGDITNGVKEAEKKGYKGTEKEILDVYGKLTNTDGTPNTEKGFLSCKKCGGGIGVCKGGVCIGISPGPPPMIKLTIPI